MINALCRFPSFGENEYKIYVLLFIQFDLHSTIIRVHGKQSVGAQMPFVTDTCDSSDTPIEHTFTSA